MKSETITVKNLFQDRRQYCVPFFQRAYVWTQDEQWAHLWDDIRDKAEARLSGAKVTPHFLGAVVLDPQPREGLMGVDSLHIIDGQQRLTTLQFVLGSAMLALRKGDLSGLTSFIAGCLQNINPETMLNPDVEVFKVWPTFKDRDSFVRAFTVQDIDELRERFPAHFRKSGALRKIDIRHPAALAAMWFFTEEFSAWILSGGDAQKTKRAEALISAILDDLKVVTIVLEKEDDAQIIFETLNGRGAQLHATDLIRNYVFMRADREGANSENLYDTLWSGFESEYWSENQRRGRINKPRLEFLIHSSLQAELHDEVDLGRLYYEYRRFVNVDGRAKSAEEQLRKINEYAGHYKELIGGSGPTPIARFGARISPYDITTLHPLALMISASGIDDESKSEMFGDLFSYVVRRAVCWLTPKNYNNFFMGTLRQIHNNGISPEHLRKALMDSAADGSRWPTDAEFKSALMAAPLYPGRLDTPKIRAVLTELEGYLRLTVRGEEPVLPVLANLDVDHIMPQSWFSYWPLAHGENVTSSEAEEAGIEALVSDEVGVRAGMINARQAAIPTLGNLTLLNLSVNREAKNFEFNRKRDLLIRNTTLRLNIPQIALTEWNETSIAARAELLAGAAIKLWPGPR